MGSRVAGGLAQEGVVNILESPQVFSIAMCRLPLFGAFVVISCAHISVAGMVAVFAFSAFIFTFLGVIIFIRLDFPVFLFVCVVLFSISMGFFDARVATQSRLTYEGRAMEKNDGKEITGRIRTCRGAHPTTFCA